MKELIRDRFWLATIAMWLAAAVVCAMVPGNALAQASYPTAVAGIKSGVVVPLQCDASGTNCTAVTAANPLQVSSTGSSGVVTGNVASAATDSGNPVKVAGKYNATLPTFTDGQRADLQLDSRGALRVIAMRSTGLELTAANAAADGSSNSITANYSFAFPHFYNGSSWDRAKKPASTSRLLSAAASTNSTLVKGSAGDLFRVTGYNSKASAVYLKLYNKATAPTCGTDTPVQTHYIPATAKFDIEFTVPYYFATGIGYCLTGAGADADTTALVAADVLALNVLYN